MRWLADECVHRIVVAELRKAGHDVLYPAEFTRQSIDRSLADQAATEGRILVTEDKDFGQIVFQEKRHTLGIVLLRFPSRLWRLKWPRLSDAISEYGEALYSRYTVIDEARTRSQPLSQA